MREERLPEARAKVSDGEWHVQPNPKEHHSESRQVERNDECTNDFHGDHNIEEMWGEMGGLLAVVQRGVVILD